MTITYDSRAYSSRAFLRQSNPGACALAAAANYLRLVAPRKRAWQERDISGALDRLPDLAEGIGEVGIATAFIRLGFRVRAHYDGTLNGALMTRMPILAALDNFDHWAVVLQITHGPAPDFPGDDPRTMTIGTCFCENFIIDSDSTARRLYKIGDAELDRRWRHPELGIYYGLTIEKDRA